jgi:hypothetical protein
MTTFKNSDEDATSVIRTAEETLPSGFLQKYFAAPTSLQEQYIDHALANPEGHRFCSDNPYIDNDADVPCPGGDFYYIT